MYDDEEEESSRFSAQDYLYHEIIIHYCCESLFFATPDLILARDFPGNDFESYRVTTDGSYMLLRLMILMTMSTRIYQLPTKHHVLKPVKDCVHCGAMRFQYEGPAFCCRKGKVKVCIPEVPQELQRLFSSQVDQDAKYFRQHIRYFNSHFSFTSLGVTLDQRVNTAARTGVYTFRAHGQLYHRLDHLVPGDHGPRHLQLYIYDTDEALEHRVKRSLDLDINLVRVILRILEKII